MAILARFTWLDYLLIGVFIMALGIGWTRGLVKVLTGFLVFVATSFIAGRYTAAVTDFINRTWGARAWLARWLEQRFFLPPETHRTPPGETNSTKVFDWLRGLPLPESYKLTLAQRFVDWSHPAGGESAATYIVYHLAGSILTTLVFIGLSTGLGWLLGWLSRFISDQVEELPLVGTINRLLGAAAVFFQTAAIIALIMGMIVPVLALHAMPQLGKAVETAYLTPYVLSFYQWLRSMLFGFAQEALFWF